MLAVYRTALLAKPVRPLHASLKLNAVKKASARDQVVGYFELSLRID
jgi:hypothetical protein